MSVQEHTIYEEIVNPIWDITKIPLVDKSTRQRELVTIFDQTGNSMFATHTPSSNQVLFQTGTITPTYISMMLTSRSR